MNRKIITLFSVILIPFTKSEWKDLKYSKLSANRVSLSKELNVRVDKTASPLFYLFEEQTQIKKVKVVGKIKIHTAIGPDKDDSYFQIGLIESGDYKPGWLSRKFLPKWLLTLVSLNKGKSWGLGNVNFYGVYPDKKMDHKDISSGSITLSFKDIQKIKEDGPFNMDFKVEEKGPYLGLWIRTDGDDSKAQFDLTISKIQLEN